MNLNAYDSGYMQGLAYAWGRKDQGHDPFNETEWAAYWAELYSQQSRPSIQDAFKTWKEYHRV